MEACRIPKDLRIAVLYPILKPPDLVRWACTHSAALAEVTAFVKKRLDEWYPPIGQFERLTILPLKLLAQLLASEKKNLIRLRISPLVRLTPVSNDPTLMLAADCGGAIIACRRKGDPRALALSRRARTKVPFLIGGYLRQQEVFALSAGPARTLRLWRETKSPHRHTEWQGPSIKSASLTRDPSALLVHSDGSASLGTSDGYVQEWSAQLKLKDEERISKAAITALAPDCIGCADGRVFYKKQELHKGVCVIRLDRHKNFLLITESQAIAIFDLIKAKLLWHREEPDLQATALLPLHGRPSVWLWTVRAMTVCNLKKGDNKLIEPPPGIPNRSTQDHRLYFKKPLHKL